MNRILEGVGETRLADYPAIATVFGEVLAKRRKQRESDSFLFRLLQLGMLHELSELERGCGLYVRELGVHEAQRKSRHEIFGAASRPRHEFDGRCGDFWAEIAAIRALSADRFGKFRPVLSKKIGQQAAAERNGIPAFIEVKNIHANETVVDVFAREIRQAYEAEKSEYGFHIIVDYPYDSLPSGEQERAIRAFVRGLKGRKPPFRQNLSLVSASALIDVRVGDGTATLCRVVGGDLPEPIDENWLLRKVRNKAEEALNQMPKDSETRVLVINVDSTTAMLSHDFFRRAQEEIRAKL